MQEFQRPARRMLTIAYSGKTCIGTIKMDLRGGKEGEIDILTQWEGISQDNPLRQERNGALDMCND